MRLSEPVAIVLASGSSARSALLNAAGVAHAVDPAGLDEGAVKTQLLGQGANAARIAGELALAKALTVAARHPDALVIGADQTLACDGRLFDKPESLRAARRQLERLAGREHQLHSALAVVRGPSVRWQHVEPVRLRMRALTGRFLDGYLAAAGESALHCVGAYQLEGRGAQLFERIEGDYFAVLGLPLLPLLGFLRGEGAIPE